MGKAKQPIPIWVEEVRKKSLSNQNLELFLIPNAVLPSKLLEFGDIRRI